MATPIQKIYRRDKQTVVGRILDAAEDEFMAHGYAAASTNRIVDRFGGSKATLFRHFDSKLAIFAAVVRRIAERMAERVSWDTLPVVGDASLPEPWLMEFGRRALATILLPDALFVGRMVIAEGREIPEVADLFVQASIAPMLGLLSARLADWAARGLIESADNADDAVLLLDTLMSGWLSRTLFGVGPEPTPAAIDREVGRSVRLFLYGRVPRAAD